MSTTVFYKNTERRYEEKKQALRSKAFYTAREVIKSDITGYSSYSSTLKYLDKKYRELGRISYIGSRVEAMYIHSVPVKWDSKDNDNHQIEPMERADRHESVTHS